MSKLGLSVVAMGDRAFFRVTRPLLRFWARRVTDSLEAVVPRPTDAPRGHAPGRDSDRILILGAGPAVGRGVSSHELALPGSLARAVAAQTGRGADVQVISDPSIDIHSVGSWLELIGPWAYDAVVLTLGVSDALAFTPPDAWKKRLTEFLTELTSVAPPMTHFLVVGIHPIRSIPGFNNQLGALADRHATKLNRITSAVVSTFSHGTYVPLSALPAPIDDRHRGPAGYAQWARELASVITPALNANRADAGRSERSWAYRMTDGVLAARQRAVDDLQLTDGRHDRRVDQIVSMARQAFGTEIALFTVLDRDRQIHRSYVGTDISEVPLSSSFCKITVTHRDGMVIPDARLDARFEHSPAVTGDPLIRFYAGYPVESPDGARIGALCVLDSHPRSAGDINLSLLRELALLIQREL